MKKLSLILLYINFSFCLSLDVPFLKQESSDTCGPVATYELLKYYKKDVSFEDVLKATYTPSIKGSLITDIKNYLEKKGLKPYYITKISLIKKALKEGSPVIALIDMGNFLFSAPHYVLIYGYEKDGFLMEDGETKNRLMSYKEFKDRWKKMGSLAIGILGQR